VCYYCWHLHNAGSVHTVATRAPVPPLLGRLVMAASPPQGTCCVLCLVDHVLRATGYELRTSLASSSLWISVVRSFHSGTTLRICSKVIMNGEGPVAGMRLASSAVSCLDGRNLAMTGISLACDDRGYKDAVS